MKVVTAGEAMGLVATTDDGLFAVGGAARVGFCGSETNVAIGLARLGIDVTWVSRLGDDTFAGLIRRTLAAEGVTVVAGTDRGRPTGLMTKESRTPSHQVVTYRRAGSPASFLSPADLPDDLLDDADLVHVTGILPALSASAAHTTRHLVAEARRRGIPVSLDVNHRSKLWSRAAAEETLRPLVADADVLFASVDEAELFVHGSNDLEELARGLQALGPSEVVLTRGGDGALAFDGTLHVADAIEVPVVDTLGAGDAFVAGYLAERLGGDDLPARLRTGTIAGAFACMSSSDWQGAPTRAELTLLDAVDPVGR